jgi:hypothetical protein
MNEKEREALRKMIPQDKPTMYEKFGWAFEQIEAHNKATQEKPQEEKREQILDEIIKEAESNPSQYEFSSPQPQATQEKCKPCQIEGNNGTCDRKDCSNSPAQESPDERQYREDVEAGVDMSTPTEVSQTWEEDYVMAGLLRNEFRIWDEKVATNWHINHEAIQAFISKKIAQAKRQERERILREAKGQLFQIGGYSKDESTEEYVIEEYVYFSDLTNIINKPR